MENRKKHLGIDFLSRMGRKLESKSAIVIGFLILIFMIYMVLDFGIGKYIVVQCKKEVKNSIEHPQNWGVQEWTRKECENIGISLTPNSRAWNEMNEVVEEN